MSLSRLLMWAKSGGVADIANSEWALVRQRGHWTGARQCRGGGGARTVTWAPATLLAVRLQLRMATVAPTAAWTPLAPLPDSVHCTRSSLECACCTRAPCSTLLDTVTRCSAAVAAQNTCTPMRLDRATVQSSRLTLVWAPVATMATVWCAMRLSFTDTWTTRRGRRNMLHSPVFGSRGGCIWALRARWPSACTAHAPRIAECTHQATPCRLPYTAHVGLERMADDTGRRR